MGEETYSLGDRLADALRLAKVYTGLNAQARTPSAGATIEVAQAQVIATVAVAEAVEALTEELRSLREAGFPVEVMRP